LTEYKEPEKQEDLQSRSGAISYDYFGGNISKETFTGECWQWCNCNNFIQRSHNRAL